MSARDIFHDAVKIALQKDGWQITHDPLSLEFGLGLLYPSSVYDSFFQLPFVQSTIQQYRLKLAIYKPEKQEILKWQD